MDQKSFYVDSCIYLNLWQKESNEKSGVLYWKIAKEFFEKTGDKNAIIYYSGYLLKELSFILEKGAFNKKLQIFNNSSNFIRAKLSLIEFNLARSIEKESNHEISFFDIIHMLLAKKTNSILITRDKKLIEISKKYNVIAKTPEEIL